MCEGAKCPNFYSVFCLVQQSGSILSDREVGDIQQLIDCCEVICYLCVGAWCKFPGKTPDSLSAGVVRHSECSDNHMTSHFLWLGVSVKGYGSVMSLFEAVKVQRKLV